MTVKVLITATSIGIFLLVFWLAGVVPCAKGAIATIHGAMQAMRDPHLDETTRERAIQSAAMRLVAASGSLIFRNLLALGAAFLPVLAADWVGIAPQEVVLAFMGRWDVIVIATVAITLGFVVGIRVWPR